MAVGVGEELVDLVRLDVLGLDELEGGVVRQVAGPDDHLDAVAVPDTESFLLAQRESFAEVLALG